MRELHLEAAQAAPDVRKDGSARAQREREYLEEAGRCLAAMSGDSPLHNAQIAAARAGICHSLSQLARAEGDLVQAEALLRESLEVARRAGVAQAVYLALSGLGHVYWEACQYDQAEECFLQALPHAARWLADYQVPATLFWLGRCAAGTEAGLSRAVTYLQCASRFSGQFQALEELHRCRIRRGQRKQVSRIAEGPPGRSCYQVAEQAAALSFRRGGSEKKRQALQEGLKLAREQGDEHWAAMFEELLAREAAEIAESVPEHDAERTEE